MNTAIAKQEAPQDRQLEALRRIASQQTPEGEIRYRKGRAGMMYKYVDGPYVIRELNHAFAWDWDFVADSEELLMNNGKPFEVKCRGTLTVRIEGRVITKTQYGCQPIDNSPSIGDCYKGAATDALKKCASMLGIALDLYDSDYKAEKYAEPEPVRNVKLVGVQPTSPAEELLALNRKLGYSTGQLRKWLMQKFGLSDVEGRELPLQDVVASLGEGELSQAIDIFREKLEAR